ncbi:hypothetical protein [Sanguibacter gelidistatuariae]|uniref:hypothetical protein n=1 Tax=Sanguibacter gelidistatuariae TaxID=1814289 RepID=UPI001113A357|nr:hypothetical protein [Sanguibacter gelidistatuariae]
MNILVTGALPPQEALRKQWRSASLASTWLHADDWYHPSVDALLEALSLGSSAESACEGLGFARADAGCGIGEAIDDLTCLFSTLNRPTPVAAVRALTIGWVDREMISPPSMSCVDAGSGLHTLEYFTIRLLEVYGTLNHGDHASHENHLLLFVDVGLENLSLCDRVGRSAGMGHTLINAFGAGHPIAVLGGGSYVSLIEPSRGTAPSERALAKNIEQSAHDLGISEFLRRPPRVWCEPLPETHEEATALLLAQRRR